VKTTGGSSIRADDASAAAPCERTIGGLDRFDRDVLFFIARALSPPRARCCLEPLDLGFDGWQDHFRLRRDRVKPGAENDPAILLRSIVWPCAVRITFGRHKRCIVLCGSTAHAAIQAVRPSLPQAAFLA
jgi:hypothetical protein